MTDKLSEIGISQIDWFGVVVQGLRKFIRAIPSGDPIDSSYRLQPAYKEEGTHH